MLAIGVGVVPAAAGNATLLRIGVVASAVLAALLLLAISELIARARAIETNLWIASSAFDRSATVAWSPASFRPPLSSPGVAKTMTV